MQEQSNKQFYISDWHYGHANVIAFDNRPFKSLLEMDEALVDHLMEELYTTPCQMFNVGAMMPWMDYTPRTLDEIIAANSHNEAVRNK